MSAGPSGLNLKILIADRLAPGTGETLRGHGAEVEVDAGLTGDTLTAALEKFDPEVLVVRSTRVEAVHLSAGRALALVVRAGAGVNTIDCGAACRQGVFVANCPGRNAAAVAELTMAHLLNLDRRFADNVQTLREGQWRKKEFAKARGLAGRRLAVIGTGTIGREVVRRAQAFQMQVIGWSRNLSPEDAAELGIERANTIVDAVRGADATTIHLALSKDTRGIIGTEVLEAMSEGAYLINTARGELVDAAALARVCVEKSLRVGLDVFDDEPAGGDAAFAPPIAEHASVYGTHHIGASTHQAEEAVAEEIIRIVAAFESGKRVPNCCNLADQSEATHLLVVRHRDQVGVLAEVLDAIRDAGHNVQEIQNLLFAEGDTACARISIVGEPTPDTLKNLETLSRVLGLRCQPLSAE